MLKSKLVLYIEPGTSLLDAATEAIAYAKKLDIPMIFQFGGEWLTATSADKPEDIVKEYDEIEKIKERRFPPRPIRKK